jgi:hypothetical protein
MTPHYVVDKMLVSNEISHHMGRAIYNDGLGTKHGGRRANEAVWLGMATHILNVREHPCLHAELHSSGYDGRNDLADKHRTVRDLHVMTKFEATNELQRLKHSDVTPRLEHHHPKWVTRQNISNDELRDDVKPNLVVCDSLNHSNRDNVHER